MSGKSDPFTEANHRITREVRARLRKFVEMEYKRAIEHAELTRAMKLDYLREGNCVAGTAVHEIILSQP